VKDASSRLGAPQLAGSIVNARTVSGKLRGSNAGPSVQRTDMSAPELPHFGRVGYLAVTRDQVAVLTTKHAALWTQLGDRVLARVPRAAIASIELEARLLSRLRIAFENDVVWEFDIPRLNRSTAESVVRELQRTG
jgi:hypothetical protein